MEIFLRGLGIGLGLIVAIGAQNAFVLSRAVRGDRPRLVAGICMSCDIVLITLAVNGGGASLAAHPVVASVATWGGVAFLVWFGARALRSAADPGALDPGNTRRTSTLRATVLATLAVTLLNPHTYLDTFVLLAGISASLEDGARQLFGAGAVTASILWFGSLATAGRALAPWLQRRSTWRVLDLAVGATMWTIAALVARRQL